MLFCISKLLIELHWLPIDKCINFKMLLAIYRVLHLSVPEHLLSILKLKIAARALCNQDCLPMVELCSHSVRIEGSISFETSENPFITF